MEKKTERNFESRKNERLQFFLLSLILQNPEFMRQIKKFSPDDDPIAVLTRIMAESDSNKNPVESTQKLQQEKSELPEADRKKLRTAYMDLFFGIAWQQWMQPGKSLGDAWLAADDICGRMIAEREKKHPNNPGIAELRKIAAERRKRIRHMIASFEHVNQPMGVPKNNVAKYKLIGIKAYNSGAAVIDSTLNELSAKNKEKAPMTTKEQIERKWIDWRLGRGR